MDTISSVDELIDRLKEKKFWIYGMGFVANIFWQSLVRYNVSRNVKGIIVTKKDTDFFCGVGVKELGEELNIQDDLICIAAHESNKNEMIKNLENRKLDNYIYVYPYLWDLKVGSPQKRNIKVKINELVKANLSDYKLVVRYLALEQYFGKNKIGYGIYIKAFRNHVDEATARRRLSTYIDLINQWESGNYNPEDNIKINSVNQIIDGHHRTILARYFGLKTINCDIYDTEESAQDIYGKKAAMTEEALKLIFDMGEIDILEQCRKKLIWENGKND